MSRTYFIGGALLALIACGKSPQQQAAADSLQRDLQLAPADSTAKLNDAPAAGAPAPTPMPQPAAPPQAAPAPKPKPKPAVAAAPKVTTMTLAAGTEVRATSNDSLHSRHTKAGETFTATVAEDIKDANGHTAIPSGAVVTYKVVTLEPAKNKSAKDGTIKFEVTQVAFGGKTYPATGTATTGTVEHTLQGQGVTAGAAVRVGGGAAAGAIVGKVIGGKTGAIVGGVAGAAGGAVLANQTADRDVVIAPGGAITFTLDADLTVTN